MDTVAVAAATVAVAVATAVMEEADTAEVVVDMEAVVTAEEVAVDMEAAVDIVQVEVAVMEGTGTIVEVATAVGAVAVTIISFPLKLWNKDQRMMRIVA